MKGNPLYILLWLFLILCFACSPGKKEKKYVIGVSQCSMTDIWRQSMIRDMEVEALNHPEIELVVMDASQDNDTQISQIKGFIKKKVDLLIISSNETEPVTPVAVEAYRAGIPTIILDRKINSDEYTTYIGADNYEIGRSIGMYISSLIKGETTILEIWGRRGSSSATERHQGFVDAMSIDPNVKIRELDGYWYRKNAYEEVLKLDSIEDVDIVFAHNDMMALGAREAIEERDSSLVRHVEFIGVDGLLGGGLGVEAVAQGKLDVVKSEAPSKQASAPSKEKAAPTGSPPEPLGKVYRKQVETLIGTDTKDAKALKTVYSQLLEAKSAEEQAKLKGEVNKIVKKIKGLNIRPFCLRG